MYILRTQNHVIFFFLNMCMIFLSYLFILFLKKYDTKKSCTQCESCVNIVISGRALWFGRRYSLSPEGSCESRSYGVHLTYFLFNCCLGNDFDTFKNAIFRRPQKNLENVLFTGGVGGWTGYPKCPLIFFILFGYIDKVYTQLYM